MAEKGETKIIAIFTICIMLISIGLSGCIEDQEQYVDEEAISQRPYLTEDTDNNIHIIWVDNRGLVSHSGGKQSTFKRYYTKINKDGETIIDDKKLGDINKDIEIFSGHPFILDSGYYIPFYESDDVDKFNNIHIIQLFDHNNKPILGVDTQKRALGIFDDDNTKLHYTKITNDNEVIKKYLIINNNVKDSLRLSTNSKGEVFIAWWETEDDFDTTRIMLIKLDSNSKLTKTLVVDEGWYYENLTYYESKRVINPSIAIDSKDNLHIIWKGIFWNKTIDSDYNIYYKKLNSNGDVLINSTQLINNTDDYSPNDIKITIDIFDNIYILYSGMSSPIQISKYNYKLDKLFENVIVNNDASFSVHAITDIDENIFAVSEGNNEIFFSKITKNGSLTIFKLITPSDDKATYFGTKPQGICQTPCLTMLLIIPIVFIVFKKRYEKVN